MAISRHLRDRHKTPIELRKQVERYIHGFPFAYNHTSVPIPADGLAPQPIIPIVDGFVCQDCPFKSRDRSSSRKHGNQAHNKKRVPDEEMFHTARLQSWFGEKREWYWAVDESKPVASVGASEFIVILVVIILTSGQLPTSKTPTRKKKTATRAGKAVIPPMTMITRSAQSRRRLRDGRRRPTRRG